MFEVVFGKCLKIARFSPPLVSKNLDRSKVGEVRIIGRFPVFIPIEYFYRAWKELA